MKHTIIDETEGKVCTQCRQWKPLVAYSQKRGTFDSLNIWCKTCCAENAKQWKRAHPAQVIDKRKEDRSRMSAAEKAQENERVKSYRKAHPERAKATQLKYRQKHRGQESQRGCQWAKNNPDKARIRRRVRQSRLMGNGGSFTIQEWEDLKKRYDYRCLCCGRREPEIKLTIDHIIPVSHPGGHSAISNIQPLCISCNASKHNRTIDYRPGGRHE